MPSFKLEAAYTGCGSLVKLLRISDIIGEINTCTNSLLRTFIINFTRQPAAGGSCADDLSQLTSAKFKSCIRVFESTSNLGHFNNATLESYCNHNCSTYIWDLLTALATDCGNSPVSSHVQLRG